MAARKNLDFSPATGLNPANFAAVNGAYRPTIRRSSTELEKGFAALAGLSPSLSQVVSREHEKFLSGEEEQTQQFINERADSIKDFATLERENPDFFGESPWRAVFGAQAVGRKRAAAFARTVQGGDFISANSDPLAPEKYSQAVSTLAAEYREGMSFYERQGFDDLAEAAQTKGTNNSDQLRRTRSIAQSGEELTDAATDLFANVALTGEPAQSDVLRYVLAVSEHHSLNGTRGQAEVFAALTSGVNTLGAQIAKGDPSLSAEEIETKLTDALEVFEGFADGSGATWGEAFTADFASIAAQAGRSAAVANNNQEAATDKALKRFTIDVNARMETLLLKRHNGESTFDEIRAEFTEWIAGEAANRGVNSDFTSGFVLNLDAKIEGDSEVFFSLYENALRGDLTIAEVSAFRGSLSDAQEEKLISLTFSASEGEEKIAHKDFSDSVQDDLDLSEDTLRQRYLDDGYARSDVDLAIGRARANLDESLSVGSRNGGEEYRSGLDGGRSSFVEGTMQSTVADNITRSERMPTTQFAARIAGGQDNDLSPSYYAVFQQMSGKEGDAFSDFIASDKSGDAARLRTKLTRDLNAAIAEGQKEGLTYRQAAADFLNKRILEPGNADADSEKVAANQKKVAAALNEVAIPTIKVFKGTIGKAIPVAQPLEGGGTVESLYTTLSDPLDDVPLELRSQARKDQEPAREQYNARREENKLRNQKYAVSLYGIERALKADPEQWKGGFFEMPASSLGLEDGKFVINMPGSGDAGRDEATSNRMFPDFSEPFLDFTPTATEIDDEYGEVFTQAENSLTLRYFYTRQKTGRVSIEDMKRGGFETGSGILTATPPWFHPSSAMYVHSYEHFQRTTDARWEEIANASNKHIPGSNLTGEQVKKLQRGLVFTYAFDLPALPE